MRYILVIQLLAMICLLIGCSGDQTNYKIKNSIDYLEKDLLTYPQKSLRKITLYVALNILRNLNTRHLESNPIIHYAYQKTSIDNRRFLCVEWLAKDSDCVDSILLTNGKNEKLILPISTFDQDMNKKASEKFVLFVMEEMWSESDIPAILKSDTCFVALLKDGKIVSKADFKVFSILQSTEFTNFIKTSRSYTKEYKQKINGSL